MIIRLIMHNYQIIYAAINMFVNQLPDCSVTLTRLIRNNYQINLRHN
jgi:hypothetical protein